MNSGSYSAFGHGGSERYGDGRHPALPWGYWLTSTGEVPGEPPLVDEDGRVWRSVRHAFWVGRLGLPDFLEAWINAILEFIMCYLAIVDGRFVAKEERVRDIFLGDRHFDTFFGTWMEVNGLVAERGRLTAEGHAALLMLIATRTREDAEEDDRIADHPRDFSPQHPVDDDLARWRPFPARPFLPLAPRAHRSL